MCSKPCYLANGRYHSVVDGIWRPRNQWTPHYECYPYYRYLTYKEVAFKPPESIYSEGVSADATQLREGAHSG